MNERTRIKFCGLVSTADIALALDAGADAVGIVLAESPRRVPLAELGELSSAIPPFVTKVGVVANASGETLTRLRAFGFTIQFAGGEPASICERESGGLPYLKVFHVRSGEPYGPADVAKFSQYLHALWHFDSGAAGVAGGSGATFAWSVVAPLAQMRRIVVSGGLTPDNVADCIRTVRPFAVDVRSGIETGGRKDPEKMRAFVRAVRDADAA